MVFESAAVVLALVGMVVAVAAQSAGAAGDADLRRLKQQLVAYWIGEQADRGDPLVAESLRGLERSAREARETMQPDGSWGDLRYQAPSGRELHLARHVSRVATMAAAFRTPGQTLHGDPDLARAVERSLLFTSPQVPGWPTSGGWWQQQIHTPRKLGETLLLMEGHVSAEAVTRTVQTMRYLLMEEAPRHQGVIWHVALQPPDAPPGEVQQATGENMVWLAQNHLYLALAIGDSKLAELASEAIAGQCAVQTGPTVHPWNEGIKEDYSFHQHGPLLYTGGYGRSFFEDVPQFLWAARGTRYQAPAAGIEVFARYALDSTLWCIYENYYDPSCRGREITRPERRPMEVPLALLVLANLPHPRQQEAISAAKRFYEVNPRYGLQTAPLWAAIKDSPVPASAPVGHKHFWESDYTVHREPGYFASLRMFSDRTRPAECIHAEGKTSWHQADGMLWVFLRGGDYAADNVLPTLDWLRLPGITVERRHLEPAEGFEGWPPPLGHRAFVGGAFTPERGVSAMELEAMVPPLTARKSWFFFGDEIVCLGSDINCPSDNPAETIVNQWPLRDPLAPLTVDGEPRPADLPWTEDLISPRWVHCDGIGYFFPEPQPLRLKREEQRGSWHDLSDSQRDTLYSHTFLTLWFDHGPQANGAAYSYVVLPRKTAAEAEAYAASGAITILAHDGRAHSVRDNARNAVGIVFWQPGAVAKVTTDRPCIVYYEDTPQGLALAVSEPTHQASTLRLTLDEPFTLAEGPAEVQTTIEGGRTVVACRAARGRNYLVRLARTR